MTLARSPLPRRRKAPKMGVRDDARKARDIPAFQQFVRGHECSVAGRVDECWGRVEFAHLQKAATYGDRENGISLCGKHHRFVQHQLGIDTFQARYGIDMKAVAERFWRAWPGRRKWEMEQEEQEL